MGGVTIHLVRHAQGFHNLSLGNESIRDPLLTDLGKEQCAELRAHFAHHGKLTHLVASPMRRTLQTCIYTFDPDGTVPLPIIAVPELQEVADSPCDTGSAVPDLKEEFPQDIDFSRVPDNWTEKFDTESPWEPTLEKVGLRARDARLILRDIAVKSGEDDVQMAVVSHGGVLHFMTDDWHGIIPERATSWANCECRSYRFVDPTFQDPDAILVETEESWQSRLGDERRPTDEEQAEMRRTYHRQLEPWLKLEAFKLKAGRELSGPAQA